jgi:hypothetical protein
VDSRRGTLDDATYDELLNLLLVGKLQPIIDEFGPGRVKYATDMLIIGGHGNAIDDRPLLFEMARVSATARDPFGEPLTPEAVAAIVAKRHPGHSEVATKRRLGRKYRAVLKSQQEFERKLA